MSKTASAKKPASAKKKVTPLNSSDFGLSRHVIAEYSAIIDSHYDLDDITDPGFWVHVSRMISGDFVKIHCLWADGSRYVILFVSSVINEFVSVKVIEDYDIGFESADNVVAAAGKYGVRYGGRTLRWLVYRISDDLIVERGISTKEEANKKAQEYEERLT
ncbi:MAG: hypothetical protein CUN56_00535 [Phototrophicales bacterium]|nr:MAG: hypothetical protein CUN56_00535 [Phototrophicales bacterium]